MLITRVMNAIRVQSISETPSCSKDASTSKYDVRVTSELGDNEFTVVHLEFGFGYVANLTV